MGAGPPVGFGSRRQVMQECLWFRHELREVARIMLGDEWQRWTRQAHGFPSLRSKWLFTFPVYAASVDMRWDFGQSGESVIEHYTRLRDVLVSRGWTMLVDELVEGDYGVPLAMHDPGHHILIFVKEISLDVTITGVSAPRILPWEALPSRFWYSWFDDPERDSYRGGSK